MEKTELEKELRFFQAWMVRYAKNPKDINLIRDYLKKNGMEGNN